MLVGAAEPTDPAASRNEVGGRGADGVQRRLGRRIRRLLAAVRSVLARRFVGVRPQGLIQPRHFRADAPAIVRVVVEAALEGDMQAASLVMSRVAPTLRSQGLPVTFDFDPSASIGRQMEQVLSAIACGEVPPDVGHQIIASVQALSQIRAVEELEGRLIALEERQR